MRIYYYGELIEDTTKTETNNDNKLPAEMHVSDVLESQFVGVNTDKQAEEPKFTIRYYNV